MAQVINNKVKQAVTNKIYDLAVDDSRFEPIADLSDDEFKLLFNILFMAIGNHITKMVTKGLPIHLNSIGKIRIKPANKIALVHKNNIAKEFGYDNFRLVPKDKLAELNARANVLTIEQIKRERKIKRPKSVRTFRFKPIKKD